MDTTISVTADDIKCVPSPSPAFLRWAWDFYERDRLDIVVQAVINADKASTAADALGYLNELVRSHARPDDPMITVEDMRPTKPGGYLYGAVRHLVRGTESNGLDPWLRHGMISHQAIGDLFAGRLTGQAPLAASLTPNALQVDLFHLSTSGQSLVLPEEFIPTSPRRALRTASNRWERLRTSMNQDWTRWHNNIKTIGLLHTSLRSIFDGYLARILRAGLDPRGDLILLTMMTWASATAMYRKLRHPLQYFTEIPVIATSHRFGGGRVDAIGVSRINGRPPTVRQRRLLSAMTARPGRFESTGQVIRELRRHFGERLDLFVIDWKFLVGDILRYVGNYDQVPRLPDVQDAPLFKHRDQMQRYLTLIPFDYSLQRRVPVVWDDQLRISGELWYFLPTSEPVVHHVEMSPQERRDYFHDEIVNRWGHYRERASIRSTSNQVLGHILNLHNPSSNGSSVTVRPPKPRQTTLIEPPPTAGAIIEELRRSNRRYADPTTNTIEIIGRRDGKPVYEMDLRQLLLLLDQGLVRKGHFSPTIGGKVACLLPGQSDSTPSLHIYLSGTPHFHCYGCGANGRINPASIPDNVQIVAAELNLKPRSRQGLPVIPEEHDRIMRRSQELLAKGFAIYAGPRRYLAKERGLPLDLVCAYGAGFGHDDTLINGLMDSGYILDDLIHYGLVGISSNIDPARGIVRLLQRRGLRIAQMERPTGESTPAGPVQGLPYAVLSGRVTFPLTLEGRHTNFYGRAIGPTKKQFTHRKLTTQFTRVEQGGFNLQVLSSDAEEVIVTEGAMDALSLIAAGNLTTSAIIGVGNAAIIQALARAGKAVAIALDNDSTGRAQTPKLIGLLRRAGLDRPVRDFTAQFVAHHPGTYKDYNNWWCHQRHAG